MICSTFFYLCSVLDGWSRYIVHWELKEQITELELEIIIQKAKEFFPNTQPRIISDNEPQFILYPQRRPFVTAPYAGSSWQPEAKALRQKNGFFKNAWVKVLTLFHPNSGKVVTKAVTTTTNEVLHNWLKLELTKILSTTQQQTAKPSSANFPDWKIWQEELKIKITLPKELPPLRMLLIMDNLAGHKTPEFVLWMFAQGIMPLYTPLSGSWLNMAESIQRILKRRALEGHHPQSPEQIMDWFDSVTRGWNQNPTPFVWGGKRATRRARARARLHQLGGSGALSHRSVNL